MHEPRSSFSTMLVRLRSAAALSQEELAERCGLSRRGISDLERGASLTPRLETVRLLADGLALGDGDRAALLTAARPALLENGLAIATPSPRRTFPVPLTRLIGRETEIAALRAALQDDDVRLLTLTGPGGVGKTRLVVEVARGLHEPFPDGVVFVDLAPITDPDLVVPTVATALGVRESAGRRLLETLSRFLAMKRLLLVLDNCEQILATTPDLTALLTTNPGLTIFATGRAPFHVHGEHEFPVLPLSLPPVDHLPAIEVLANVPAVTLFIERATAVQPDFTLTQAHAAVAAICHKLDGLPLAIELAAAWVKVLPPAVLLVRLEQRLSLLTGGGRDLPERQRTMRDAIAWSYDLLTSEEQLLFSRLAVFVGGFSLEAAEWVVDALTLDSEMASNSPPSATQNMMVGAPSVVDLLAGLIDKSLLRPISTNGVHARFTMLETVREFALERLRESGEAGAAKAAQAAYMVALAERAEAELLGPNERQWHADLARELPNLRAALNWGLVHDVDTTLRIAGALWVYWVWYHVGEGRRWLRAALNHPSSQPALIRARALTTQAALAILAGDVPRSVASSELAIPLAHASAHSVCEAYAWWMRGFCHFFAGDVATAIPELDAALALFEHTTTTTDRSWGAYARSIRGAATLVCDDEDRGLQFYEEALARVRAAGSDGVTIMILGDFAGWLLDRGETARARGMVEEALALATDHPGIWLQAPSLIGLALAEALEGEAAAAARHLGAVERLRASGGIGDLPAHFQLRVERATALATSALGAEVFAAAMAEGRANPYGFQRASS